MRRKAAPAGAAPGRAASSVSLLAKLEQREAADGDVLAEAAGDLRAERLDRAGLLLVLVAHELLVEQDDRGEVLGELALHGALARVLGDVLRLALVDGALGGDVVLRHVLLRDELRLEGGDVEGDVVDEVTERVGARDEIGLAVDLEQHADAAARVDVAVHDALVRLAA